MHQSKSEIGERSWNPISGCLYECRGCRKRQIAINLAGDIRLNLGTKQYQRQTPNTYVLNENFISPDIGAILTYPFGFCPTYHRYRLQYPEQLKNGYRIMVCEMGDMFGPWIPDNWIEEIFTAAESASKNFYLFKTRNIKRYAHLYARGKLVKKNNFWYGVHITESSSYIPQMPNLNLWANIAYPVSNKTLLKLLENPHVKWVVLEDGGQELANKATREELASWCDGAKNNHTSVFMKSSMENIVGAENMVKEFPEQLKKKYISEKVRKKLEGDCMSCGRHLEKKQMIALCARSVRGEMPKQIGHLCKECFLEQMESWNVDIPKLACMEDKINEQ